MSIIQGNAHTSAGGGYQIERSLRFNSADSAYLNRTPASASNRRTFTWSGWVKRCNSATTNSLFSAYVDANNFFLIQFRENGDNGRFEVFNYSSAFDFRVETNALLRDPSAWYHIVVALDTTQATSSNRIKIYVNGTEQTLATTTYPTLNFDTDVNTTNAHNIGADGASGRYHNGYLTEVNFIDGQALTPSSFGETDSNTGVWKPKAYTGTYGTNGFYLKFADNSGTTSTTLGKDSSGNGNNWTPNNFSVTAGAGNDSLTDTPTSYGTDTGVGGEVRGNYATLNPLQKNSTVTIANGNLDITTSSDNREVLGTLAASSGKWYFEVTFTSQTNTEYIGICDTSYTLFDGSWSSQVRAYISNGNKWNGSSSSYGASYTTNDVIGVAYDIDAGTIVFYKNNSSQGTAFTDLNGKSWRPFINNGISNAVSCNFGQRAFAYTAPSGFKALCTQNLPTPTIGATSTTQANDYMNAVLYSGTLSTVGSNQLVTGVGFQPDFTWIKCRSNAANHIIADSLRYVSTTNNNTLNSNTTDAEADDQNTFRGFDSDGFNVGYYDVTGNTGKTYVAWNWKANGAGSSNTAGTITSTVSANTTSGFSIVTYTGQEPTPGTIGHGLGTAPFMIITKNRSGTGNWAVYHKFMDASSPQAYYAQLNSTSARINATDIWNNTAPTSTVFSVGNAGTTNASGSSFVAYCFAPVAGYSAFGSYTGNGSTDGPFVYLGFRPEFIMIKASSEAGSWLLGDTARSPYNIQGARLFPNATNAEDNNFLFDYLSNGFKVRNSASGNNTNGQTYIYAAFAETPAKFSLAF